MNNAQYRLLTIQHPCDNNGEGRLEDKENTIEQVDGSTSHTSIPLHDISLGVGQGHMHDRNN